MELPPFHITAASIGDVALVSVSGELDLYTKDEFCGSLDAAHDSGATSTIADLTAVSFIDSTTIGVLTAYATRLRNHGGRLIVVSQDPRTQRVFEITGVDRVFTVLPTLHAAIDALVPGHARSPRVAVA